MSVPWSVEDLAQRVHAIYQAEAKRQGDVRHADNYYELSDAVKEYDRALARWVLNNFVPKEDTIEPDGSGE